MYYNFFSAPGFAVNVKTEAATFRLRKPQQDLVVDGSFITEVHVVAGGVSLPAWAWANASFWADQLDDFNTGAHPTPSTPPAHPRPTHPTMSIAFTLARRARDQRHVRQPPVQIRHRRQQGLRRPRHQDEVCATPLGFGRPVSGD